MLTVCTIVATLGYMAKIFNIIKDAWIKAVDFVQAHPHVALAALLGSVLSRLVF